MEIHGEHAIHAGSGEEIGHELGRDRHARLVLSVLTGIAKEKNHGGDPGSARATGGVHHDQKLHDVLIGGRAARLHEEYIATANVLVELHHRLAVREGIHGGVSQWHVAIFCNPASELPVSGAAENLHLGRWT